MVKILIFDQNLDFLSKFVFLIKICILLQIFDFWSKFGFLIKSCSWIPHKTSILLLIYCKYCKLCLKDFLRTAKKSFTYSFKTFHRCILYWWPCCAEFFVSKTLSKKMLISNSYSILSPLFLFWINRIRDLTNVSISSNDSCHKVVQMKM